MQRTNKHKIIFKKRECVHRSDSYKLCVSKTTKIFDKKRKWLYHVCSTKTTLILVVHTGGHINQKYSTNERRKYRKNVKIKQNIVQIIACLCTLNVLMIFT